MRRYLVARSEPVKKPSRNKYNAVKTTIDGITFSSKKEGRQYSELRLQEKAGEVLYFLMQVPFRLPGGVIYRVDFQVFYPDGSVRYLDPKGRDTPVSKLKRKQVEALYPIKIELV